MTFESSIRRRYWAGRLRETAEAHPAVALFALLILCIVGIVLASHNGLAVLAIAALGIYLGRPFLRAVQPGVPAKPPAARSASSDPELTRLLAQLEKAEQRLVHLEAIVTDKEYAWHQKFQEPPAGRPDH